MENTITVKPIETREAAKATRQAELMIVEARDIVIKTQPDYENAADILKIIKGRLKKLVDMRKAITIPLDEAKRKVMDLFRTPQQHYSNAESFLKEKMITYTDEQERVRKVQEEKLRKQAEAEEVRKKKALEERAKKAKKAGKVEKAEELREKAEDVHVEAPVLAPRTETPKGVSYKDKWYAVVVDKTKIPIEHMEPNMQMLNKIAQATKGQLLIPGVEFKSEKIVASRSDS